MGKRIDLSVIVLNYNTQNLLRACLESIRKSKVGNLAFETIVVDNHSTDESALMVKKNFNNVRLVENSDNLGFAAGNNQGIKIACGKYILLLNPDTQVAPETLVTMVDFLEKDPQIGVATCKVELVSGMLDDACHRGFPTPWNAFCYFSGLAKIFPTSRLFNGYHLGYQNMDIPHEIDSCVGAFMMIRREVGEALNWLDEDYFWYGEDLDFCYRAKFAGWKIVYIPFTKILHWKGAASGIKKESREISTATLETKRMAALASVEAMRIFYRKHYANKYPKLLTNFILLGISLLQKKRVLKIKPVN